MSHIFVVSFPYILFELKVLVETLRIWFCNMCISFSWFVFLHKKIVGNVLYDLIGKSLCIFITLFDSWSPKLECNKSIICL